MFSNGLLWLLSWIGLTGWLLSIIAVIPVALWLRKQGCIPPQIRRQRVFLLASLPWLGPVTGFTVVLLPAMLTYTGFLVDHCEEHGFQHLHLCFRHLPDLHVGPVQAGLSLCSSLLLGLALLSYIVREGRQYRRMKSFLRLLNAGKPVSTVAANLPPAITAGILKPRIVITRSMCSALTRKEKRAVLLHEIAHVRAGDPLRNLVFEGLLRLQIPWVARHLRRQWRQAMEEQADDYAVSSSGALVLAEALLKVARLQSTTRMPIPVSALRVDGVETPGRIRRLLAPASYVSSSVNWAMFLLTTAVVLLFLSPVLHHSIETLLGYFVTEHYR